MYSFLGETRLKHTQLNVRKREELSCFLYLMQIFGTLVEKKTERNVVEKASGTKPTRFPMHEIPTDN